MVEQISRSIEARSLGVCPEEDKFIAIFSETRLEWIVTQIAACSDSITIVPISIQKELLDEDRVCYILETTGVSSIFCSQKTVSIIIDLKKKGKVPTIKNVIIYD